MFYSTCLNFKVIGHTFRGDNSAIFDPFLNGSKVSKKNIASPGPNSSLY